MQNLKKKSIIDPAHGLLETFRQVLYDQLMPWLAENNDELFYRSWQQHVFQEKKFYLRFLAQLFESNKRLLPTALVDEWEIFAQTPRDERAFVLLENFLAAKTGNHKVAFYHNLLGYAFYGSYKHFIKLDAIHQGDRLKYEFHRFLRQMDDLINRSRQLCNHHSGFDLEITYMALLLMLTLRTELLKRLEQSLITPHMQLVEPDVPAPEQLADSRQAGNLGKYYNWYEKSCLRPVRAITEVKHLVHDSEPNAPSCMDSMDETDVEASIPAAGPAASNEAAFYNTRQVASMLQLSENTIRKMADNGKLHGKKFGKNYRYPKAAIDKIQTQKPY